MTKTFQNEICERIGNLEARVKNVEDNIKEIGDDVKKLLVRNADSRGKLSVWDRILMAVIGGICGFISGKL